LVGLDVAIGFHSYAAVEPFRLVSDWDAGQGFQYFVAVPLALVALHRAVPAGWGVGWSPKLTKLTRDSWSSSRAKSSVSGRPPFSLRSIKMSPVVSSTFFPSRRHCQLVLHLAEPTDSETTSFGSSLTVADRHEHGTYLVPSKDD
jgi:hypothetical protein